MYLQLQHYLNTVCKTSVDQYLIVVVVNGKDKGKDAVILRMELKVGFHYHYQCVYVYTARVHGRPVSTTRVHGPS